MSPAASPSSPRPPLTGAEAACAPAGERGAGQITSDPRTYRVVYKRDFHPGSDLHWRVHFWGVGHWCRCDGQHHAFTTRERAEAAGREWVATGGAERNALPAEKVTA